MKKPLPSTMHIFKKGTSTRINLYADPDCIEPLSNPVLANSKGEFRATYPEPNTPVSVEYQDLVGNVLHLANYEFFRVGDYIRGLDHDEVSESR